MTIVTDGILLGNVIFVAESWGCPGSEYWKGCSGWCLSISIIYKHTEVYYCTITLLVCTRCWLTHNTCSDLLTLYVRYKGMYKSLIRL